MKILNIDAFAQSERQINLNGTVYAVEEPSVQQFIDNLRASEALEAAEASGAAKQTVADSFDQAVKALMQAIPTMPEHVIRALKLPAMTMVLKFTRGEIDPDVPTPIAGEGTEEKKPD